MVANAREQRGRVIAETCAITNVGRLRHVPSQSGRGPDSVNLGRTYCSCPDFTERGHDCTHRFAARFTVTQAERHADGPETVTTVSVEKRQTCPQDWPNYNRAQGSEGRHVQACLADICRPRRPARGRSPPTRRAPRSAPSARSTPRCRPAGP